jgi:hypothetical protein
MKIDKTLGMVFTVLLMLQAQAQKKSYHFGINAALNYGYPQIDAALRNAQFFEIGYVSNYSAGFGLQIGGIFNWRFGKKAGLRTGLGAEWRSYTYEDIRPWILGIQENPESYNHRVFLMNVPVLFQYWVTKSLAIEIGPEFNFALAQNIEDVNAAGAEPDLTLPSVVVNLGIPFRIARNSYLSLNARWGITSFASYQGPLEDGIGYADRMEFWHRGLSLNYYYVFE